MLYLCIQAITVCNLYDWSPVAEARASNNFSFCLTTLAACLSGQKPRQQYAAKYLL